MTIERTFSMAEVVEIFRPGRSDSWLRVGVQTGKFPCLKVGQTPRFTADHIEQIAEALEKRPVKTAAGPADVSVLGATSRSAKAHRNRVAS
jgi:hypothetical protein